MMHRSSSQRFVRILCRVTAACFLATPFAPAQQPNPQAAPPSIINPHYDHRYDTFVVKSPQGFTHPGILHSRAELNTMRDMVWAGYQPWASGFSVLRAAPQASRDYVMLGPYKRVEHGIGQYEFRRDASAAYDQTIMWYITGDSAYANNAIKILNAWASTLSYFESDHITGGMAGQKFAAAAEILRYTPSSGWKPDDIEQFKKFLVLLTPAVDKPNLFMNQGGYGLIGAVSIAVFLDDANLYKKQINRATVGDGNNPLKDPAISKTIWPSGQVVEMGRDQAHPQGGLGTLACVAKTASIQGLALTGVDLYTYLDDRLLKGYEYLAAYELGYDEEYKPTDASGHPGFYSNFNTTSRGDISPIFAPVYNHYRYILNVPPAQLRFVKEVLALHAPEGASEDFPGFGTLTDTPIEAKEDTPPIGPPREEPKPIDLAAQYGRFQAANFSGSKGVSREYYTDPTGHIRLIASQIKADFSSWYNDFDFGPIPVDTFLASAGSASSAGSKIDVRLDRPDGELITTLTVGNTGWWSTFETFSSKLNHPVSGRHTLYLRFYGGNHVYGFQCNLDWFKFANHSAQARNFAIQSDVHSGTIIPAGNGEDSQSLRMKNGSSFQFRTMDFDDGAAFLRLRVATTGASSLQLHRGTPNGPQLAAFPLPNTHGQPQTLNLAMILHAIYGINDVSFVAAGAGEITLDWLQFTTAAPRFPQIPGARYSAVVQGSAERHAPINAPYYASATAATTLAYPGVSFSNGVTTLALHVATAHEGTIEIRSMDRRNPPIAVIPVPATGGDEKWQTLYVDLGPDARKLKGAQMLFLTFPTQPINLGWFQFDPFDEPTN